MVGRGASEELATVMMLKVSDVELNGLAAIFVPASELLETTGGSE